MTQSNGRHVPDYNPPSHRIRFPRATDHVTEKEQYAHTKIIDNQQRLAGIRDSPNSVDSNFSRVLIVSRDSEYPWIFTVLRMERKMARRFAKVSEEEIEEAFF